MLWIINASILSKDTIDKYIQFFYRIIKICVPDSKVIKDTELYNSVTTYYLLYIQNLPESIKIELVAIILASFFTDRIIVSVTLLIDVCDKQRKEILEHRNMVLSKVKQYIDDNLHPKIRNERKL